MVNKITKLLLVVVIMLVAKVSFANNLVIDNFDVVSSDTASNTITYSCDIQWDNSWKTTTSMDAVWVFLKYSTDAGRTWKHASMAGSGIAPMGFSSPANFQITVPQDERGFFIKRTDLGSGNVAIEGVELVWDYGQDGLTDAQALAANTINKIFGIEMVYVAEGSFYAGDGNSSSEYKFVQGFSDTEPWYIQNENAITTTSGASDGFYYQGTGMSGENNNGSVFLVPTSFPKGYQGFYQMKYELTEGQWVGFFNTLSMEEKNNRDITSAVNGGKNSDAVIYRNTIAWDASNIESAATTARPDRAMSFISWPDLLAYADWAALRPMTELEFEKSARGKDITAVANEFAWGNTSSNVAAASEIYPNIDEDGTEQIYDGAANLNRNSLGWTSGDGRVGGVAEGQAGPLRVGIFAESSTSRVSSGAGYYGTMELSGNLYEMVVTLGNSQGRKYLGTHGDGQLTTVAGYKGNATNIDWPGINAFDSARGVTGTIGSGYRGGDFQSPNALHYQTSNRSLAVKDPDTGGYSQRYDVTLGIFQGGRLVRTTP